MSKQVQMFDHQTGATLVKIARRSLEEYVRHQQRYKPDFETLPNSLCQPGCSFVTLTHHGQLRGCMGNTQARYPLAEDVAYNAVSAASRDPRFTAVAAHELAELRLEVTILTPPEVLPYRTYEELLDSLRPGVDGVILSLGMRRGLLLPQVWDRLTEPGQFLRMITYKAGISAHELMAYPPTVTVHTFRVQHFHELGYREPGG
jgi:AmmeMemoRadiSam system protein A